LQWKNFGGVGPRWAEPCYGVASVRSRGIS
jgi:hypothetical protein